ncbi:hypothetical protein DZ956_022425 [Pseudomonas aeruginosa]|uniref:hypothetical protein n=1 Tax=Pseudomonas aeruginosa TaxID=287 RepID=UPI0015C559F0|nr:hypothetical protein [Pseudomonas aeruginosa]NPZ19534.1 hypothetical protein [Pseudomonas aeruginosa]
MGRHATVLFGADGKPLSPAERTRELARLRKKKQRKAEAADQVRAQALPYKFEVFPGTRDDLDLICKAEGFEEWAEFFTLVARNVADQIRRDSHDYRSLLAFPSRKKEASE